MKLFLFGFFLSAASSFISAQDYYPLQAGNVWYLGRYPTAILEKTTINNIEYFLTNDSVYERVDDGNVKRYNDSSEYTWIKLNAALNESWQIQYPTSYGLFRLTGTLLSKTETINTGDTIFYNCYRYGYRYANVIDADYDIYLAPGVGIVKDSSVDWGAGSTLIKGLVNGKKIPFKTIPPAVMYTLPEDNQSNVPVDVQMAVSFRFQIKPEYINEDNIKIISKKYGNIPFHFDQSWGGRYHDVRFTPDNLLAYNDTISVVVSNKIKDYMGDSLPGDFTFTFFTESFISDPHIFIKDTLLKISKLAGEFDFADYDNDSDQDLILFGRVDTVDAGIDPKLEVYENNSGNFVKEDYEFNATDFEYEENCVKWVDFNHDGLNDIVFSGLDENSKPLTQFYENKNPGFALRQDMNLSFGRASMQWADFNKDGYDDLAISGTSQPKTQGIVLYKNEKGLLNKYATLGVNYYPKVYRWVDFNMDGDIDIVGFNYQLKETKFFQNTNGNFSEVQFQINYEESIPLSNIEAADIDKDGDQDFLIAGYLLYKSGDRYILDKSQIDYFNDAFVKFVKLNDDDYDDLLIIGNKPDEVGRYRTYIQVYINYKGRFILNKEMRLNKYIYLDSARWLDLNNDSKPDLAVLSNEGFTIYYNIMEPVFISIGDPISDFELLQNFPNPFNPLTTINYNLPEAVHVLIKVYDLLGNEVSVLVNEDKEKGRYKVNFNGSRLSSGVYFYTIKAGNFYQTKKMLLIK